MESLLNVYARDSDVKSVITGLQAGFQEQIVSGLAGSSKQMMIATLAQQLARPIVVVTHNLYAAQKISDDLVEMLSADQVLLYPANELIAAEAAISSPETVARRVDVLAKLSQQFRGVLVVPISGLRRFLPSPEVVAHNRMELTVGDVLPISQFARRAVALGYTRVDKVETRGEFSVRGGIVDIFPLLDADPLRIEWFDDDIDSIRTFDVNDQRSKEMMQSTVIFPCKEIVADEQRFEQAARHAQHLLDGYAKQVTERGLKERFLQEIGGEIEQLQQHQYSNELYKYISLLYPERHTLLDYMEQDSILVFDEPARLSETAKQLDRDETEWTTHLMTTGKWLPQFAISRSAEDLLQHRKFQAVFVSLFLRQVPHTTPKNVVNVVSRSMQSFHGQMNVLKAEVERWNKSGTTVVLLASSAERVSKFERVLEDFKIAPQTIVVANVQEGFELPNVQLAVITENEVFSQKSRKTRRADTTKIDNAERIKSYTELKIGDYVVHQSHGIGKYIGISTVEIAGIHRDYMHILYASGDKLSVPIDQIDLVQKYVGAEDREPKISKLGGTEWSRMKSKAKASVKDIADDLIKLYAERQATAGYAFGQDSTYQQEFEDAFNYDETRDQLRAIAEIKADMMKPRPMDRLLCGDVGYGKTEVALRAAFKAAIEGKQVAILVPTTILAQQHFETFKERFNGFPFNIQVMSRFRSRKDQNVTVKGLANGTVDIVVGTHRLLSQDVIFKDLGLIIVDEEQRFGVTHKERLKKLKSSVDVLTLTATPIPRTLHMSMLGVRDLSVIETPPENRFPVQTYVLEHSPALVREAIEREMARGGQIYYLYNRVQGIYQMAEQIQALVPNAKISVGHGQMTEQQLEKTILDFLDGESDVLVSTSIIETGVDIPNVNTLIVHDADKLGLSQLYQIRGRVGRSNRIAYAYFTYQRDKVLNEVAEKRLQSIKEFTELGSGFKIAMRDLSIRGAGNLLGAEQHGFIASVGFEMYSQMLADEIAARKVGAGLAENEAPKIVTFIDLQVDAYLPSEYIYDSIQKIEIYKKVAAARTSGEIDELEDELLDRFGELPIAVRNLLMVARLKIVASQLAVEQISQKKDDLIVKLHETSSLIAQRQQVTMLTMNYQNRLAMMTAEPQSFQLLLRGKGMDVVQKLTLLAQFFDELKPMLQSRGVLQDVTR